MINDDHRTNVDPVAVVEDNHSNHDFIVDYRPVFAPQVFQSRAV
jgi:hypothetical protein